MYTQQDRRNGQQFENIIKLTVCLSCLRVVSGMFLRIEHFHAGNPRAWRLMIDHCIQIPGSNREHNTIFRKKEQNQLE